MRVQSLTTLTSLTLGVSLKEGVSISVSVKGLSEMYNFFHMNWAHNQVQS